MAMMRGGLIGTHHRQIPFVSVVAYDKMMKLDRDDGGRWDRGGAVHALRGKVPFAISKETDCL